MLMPYKHFFSNSSFKDLNRYIFFFLTVNNKPKIIDVIWPTSNYPTTPYFGLPVYCWVNLGFCIQHPRSVFQISTVYSWNHLHFSDTVNVWEIQLEKVSSHCIILHTIPGIVVSVVCFFGSVVTMIIVRFWSRDYQLLAWYFWNKPQINIEMIFLFSKPIIKLIICRVQTIILEYYCHIIYNRVYCVLHICIMKSSQLQIVNSKMLTGLKSNPEHRSEMQQLLNTHFT